jgi:hypothetical protein
MAIYHLSVQTISRGQGKSCVASSAYRAGEKLHDERQDLNHDYTKKQGIESEIIAPSNAPSWVNDREKLWNEVDRAETRCNSRTAREINIALPLELSKEQQKELIRGYVKENFVDKGMVADVCFHFNDSNNPHCHVMLTTREIDQEGFTKKNREWDKKENVEEWREQWANHSNKALEKANCQERIDHRSYKDQGIDQVPTIHLGKTSCEMEKKGINNPRVEINNQIKELNKEKVIALQEYRELKDKLEKEKSKETQRYSNLKPEEKATVQKAEVFLKAPQTYDNSNKALEVLNTMKKEELLKLSKINSNVAEIKKRSYSINNSLERLRGAENEFKELSKNVFGQYKDKNRAESLKTEIQRYKNDLANDGYKGSSEMILNEKKLEALQKDIGELKSKIQAIDQASSVITDGVKALQNKELRDFYKGYKDNFPQAKYLTYSDMRAIKTASELMGRPVYLDEIKASYCKNGERVDSIDKELRSIEDNGRRLISAKQALETIDKHKDIADKWDTKVFGKAKYQEEHRVDKWEYDNAVSKLKELGIKDKFNLKNEERSQAKNTIEIKPKLEAEKATIAPTLNVLNGALKALEGALRASRQQQHQEQSKITKAFKGKNREDELEM